MKLQAQPSHWSAYFSSIHFPWVYTDPLNSIIFEFLAVKECRRGRMKGKGKEERSIQITMNLEIKATVTHVGWHFPLPPSSAAIGDGLLAGWVEYLFHSLTTLLPALFSYKGLKVVTRKRSFSSLLTGRFGFHGINCNSALPLPLISTFTLPS